MSQLISAMRHQRQTLVANLSREDKRDILAVWHNRLRDPEPLSSSFDCGDGRLCEASSSDGHQVASLYEARVDMGSHTYSKGQSRLNWIYREASVLQARNPWLTSKRATCCLNQAVLGKRANVILNGC